MRKILGNLSDLKRNELENHFSRVPGDAFFASPTKVFMIQAIEAGGGWTLDYTTMDGSAGQRTGSGDKDFYHPVVAAEITGAAGVQRLVGYWVGR